MGERKETIGYFCYSCKAIHSPNDVVNLTCSYCGNRVWRISDKKYVKPPISETRKKKIEEIFKINPH